MEVCIVVSSINKDLLQACMVALQADIVPMKSRVMAVQTSVGPLQRETTSPILPETHTHCNRADAQKGEWLWPLPPPHKMRRILVSVSYTHLTLPTKRIVYISGF